MDCSGVVDANESILKTIAYEMYSKIKKCEHLICSNFAQVALMFDPLFGYNLLEDDDLFRRHVLIDGSEGEAGDNTSVTAGP